jgi:hypothetical protein
MSDDGLEGRGRPPGYGRELSAQGMRAFCNLKTVLVGDA